MPIYIDPAIWTLGFVLKLSKRRFNITIHPIYSTQIKVDSSLALTFRPQHTDQHGRKRLLGR